MMNSNLSPHMRPSWAAGTGRGIARTLHTLVSPGDGADALPWSLRLVRSLAVQDWWVVGYFAVLLLLVLQGRGPHRELCIERVGMDLGCVLVGLVMVRGHLVRWGGRVSAGLYRFVLTGTVLGSYFQLKDILPEVTTRALDPQILAFDRHVFHYEPALAWDRFVNPHTVEWFAFFYFGYFVLISLYVLGSMFLARDRHRLAEFSLGVLLVFCTGHITYMLVPGFGPYHFLDRAFAHRLEGATFWHLVQATVQSAGAQKDIFPSLHTGVPTFMSLFAIRHRRVSPFRYAWLPTVLFTSQIIVATMFLRWHYLVDIAAGLTLASVASVASARIAVWERGRREAMGVTPIWTPLFTLPVVTARPAPADAN